MIPSDEQPRPAAPVPGPRPTPASSVGADAADQGTHDVEAAVAATVDLEQRPVAEHVAVFEQAHVTLRAALDEAAGSGPARG